MRYKYSHFIKENVAPSGATRIVIQGSSGQEVATIPLGRLARPAGEPLYRFGLVSDLHMFSTNTSWRGNQKFDNALSFFERVGCDFCAHAGDMTQTGLYLNGAYDPSQMAEYKRVVDLHPNLPVYGIYGNHDGFGDSLTAMREYTGFGLHYMMEYQGDVFIFCGQPEHTTPMSDESFVFLAETLAANWNRRCFVFVHPIWDDDSGDALQLYSRASLGGAQLSKWSRGDELKALLAQYPNVVLFHGHTHIKVEEQAKDKSLNYTKKNGFHSVHVPSVGRPRNVIDGALAYADAESQGYVVDVYGDCLVLNGWDFIDNQPVSLGTLRISI